MYRLSISSQRFKTSLSTIVRSYGKNYELEYEVETVEPVVQTASNTTQQRNWTIVLTNVGEQQLEVLYRLRPGYLYCVPRK